MLPNWLKVAVKVLLRRKLFTAISLFGISFTLVVLVVAVAMLDYVLAPQPPEVHQDRSVAVWFAEMVGEHSATRGSPGYKLIDRYVRGLPGTERLTVYLDSGRIPSYVNGRRVESQLKRTDAEFWQVMAFTYLEGGPYTEEDVAQARPVAVITNATRAKFFGGAPALGKSIDLDGQRLRVVGVVPEVSLMRPLPYADVWAPLTTSKTNLYRDDWVGRAGAVVLARNRADIPAMKAELRARLGRWESPDPREFQRLGAWLETPFEAMAHILFRKSPEGSRGTRLGLALALGAVLFMLLPAVNLVNLNVSRILERASEIGVRKAFGASSRALVAQFVVENVLLTLIGAVLAFLLSVLALRALGATQFFGAAHFEVSVRVFLVGLGLALFFGLLSGVYPAWKMSRLHPLVALQGGGR